MCDFEPLNHHVAKLQQLVKAAQSVDEMSQTITDLLSEQRVTMPSHNALKTKCKYKVISVSFLFLSVYRTYAAQKFSDAFNVLFFLQFMFTSKMLKIEKCYVFTFF